MNRPPRSSASLPGPEHADDWRRDADSRIERIRKGDFVVELRGRGGASVANARVEHRLKRHGFLFGTAIAHAPFADGGEDGRRYRQFILDRFSSLVCENEMKWYATEVERGREDYGPADDLLAFAEGSGLAMRGHCLFWEKHEFAQSWLAALDRRDLGAAVERRLASAVGRYAGRLVAWDVNNETLDGSFYRERLGADATAWMFREAARLDPETPLFVNEYGILGEPEKTERYLALVRDLRSRGAEVGGIGIQSHDCDRLTAGGRAALAPGERPEWLLGNPLTPAGFFATLDRLHGETGLPIHLTEVSAKTPDAARRADVLEMLFRLGFSHPAVQAILLWGFGATTHWMGPEAALMSADGTLTPAGDRITRLLCEEWTTRGSAVADADGRLRFRGFFGTYALSVAAADGRRIVREVNLRESTPTVTVQTAD